MMGRLFATTLLFPSLPHYHCRTQLPPLPLLTPFPTTPSPPPLLGLIGQGNFKSQSSRQERCRRDYRVKATYCRA